MNKAQPNFNHEQQANMPASEELAREVGLLAGRLAAFLRGKLADDKEPLASALGFLDHAFMSMNQGRPLSEWEGTLLDHRIESLDNPVQRLVRSYGFSPCEVDLMLFAGLAEEHEGYADIFRALHPLGQPRPTVGFAAQFLCHGPAERNLLRKLLMTGPAANSGAITIDNEAPFFNCNLYPANRLWFVLHGIDVWPEQIERVQTPISSHGLEHWLQQPAAVKAHRALERRSNCSILITADDEDTAFHRAAVLVKSAAKDSVRIKLPAGADPQLEKLIGVHAVARDWVPILLIRYAEGPQKVEVPAFRHYPGPVIYCSRGGVGRVCDLRPLINVHSERLRPIELRKMWGKTIPELAEHAVALAARYPVEPSQARQVAFDLDFRKDDNPGDLRLDDVAASVRARATTTLGGGVQRIRPLAKWKHLVLPAPQLRQLKEAINRLYLQGKVLDDWRFLEGRRGSRGVRMLFSGPPGTGKTLSAEVVANALDVDLLLVDISRIVSKWIGETEKNLAEVFETAERAKAVLLFDEADALFGKRTEISDAHDRYANLETAYLLSRLERFEGLAILSTNLRQNIDTAFTRRVEFIVDFKEPAREGRLALWKCHLPPDVPLADDVNLEELASNFAIVGGLIRNAAVAAAFLAASEDVPIARRHFINAVRREYEKSGKAYREVTEAVSQF
jgi:hypothetical protein